MQNWVKEIVVDSKFENVRTLTDFVESSLEPLHPSPKAIMQIGVAIDELFSNVVRYSGSSNMKLILNVNADVLTAKLTFIDEGVDLLIVSPNQVNTISSAIERAYDKGEDQG